MFYTVLLFCSVASPSTPATCTQTRYENQAICSAIANKMLTLHNSMTQSYAQRSASAKCINVSVKR